MRLVFGQSVSGRKMFLAALRALPGCRLELAGPPAAVLGLYSIDSRYSANGDSVLVASFGIRVVAVVIVIGVPAVGWLISSDLGAFVADRPLGRSRIVDLDAAERRCS